MEQTLGTLLIANGIVSAIRNLPQDALSAAEQVALDVMSENVSGLDFDSQETRDLLVRPLAMTILASEIALRNMFSESSLYGVHVSKTMSDEEKSFLFSKYATLNGLELVSTAPNLQYSELQTLVKGVFGNLKRMIAEAGEAGRISSVYIADKNSKEMTRDKVSYIMLNTQKINAMSHDEHELNTITSVTYSRDEVETYQNWKNASRIKLGGCVDVIFISPLIEETITLPVSNNRAILSPEYYIDIAPRGLTMEYVVEHTDDMYDGIVKAGASIYIQDEVSEVEVVVKYYQDPNFDAESENQEIEITDILFKGAYPLLLDLTLYTKEDIDVELARDTINRYLEFNNHQITCISPSEIHAALKMVGIQATVSSSNQAKIFLNNSIYKTVEVIFPLTMRDIPLHEIMDKDRVSENTIGIYLDSIIVVKD